MEVSKVRNKWFTVRLFALYFVSPFCKSALICFTGVHYLCLSIVALTTVAFFLNLMDSMLKVKELTGHTARVLHLAQSPDGTTVVSAAPDETIRFWNVFGGPSVSPDECWCDFCYVSQYVKKAFHYIEKFKPRFPQALFPTLLPIIYIICVLQKGKKDVPSSSSHGQQLSKIMHIR